MPPNQRIPWDEANPFAALVSVLSRAELVRFRARLAREGCQRTAGILDDEIAERDLGLKIAQDAKKMPK